MAKAEYFWFWQDTDLPLIPRGHGFEPSMGPTMFPHMTLVLITVVREADSLVTQIFSKTCVTMKLCALKELKIMSSNTCIVLKKECTLFLTKLGHSNTVLYKSVLTDPYL